MGTSTEEVPPSDWPVGKTVGDFLDYRLKLEGPAHWRFRHWAGGAELKASWGSHGEKLLCCVSHLCSHLSSCLWTKWSLVMRTCKPHKPLPSQVVFGHSVYQTANYSEGHKSKMPSFCGLESGCLVWIPLVGNVTPLLLQFLEAVSLLWLMASSHFLSQQWIAKPLPCHISNTDFFPFHI